MTDTGPELYRRSFGLCESTFGKQRTMHLPKLKSEFSRNCGLVQILVLIMFIIRFSWFETKNRPCRLKPFCMWSAWEHVTVSYTFNVTVCTSQSIRVYRCWSACSLSLVQKKTVVAASVELWMLLHTHCVCRSWNIACLFIRISAVLFSVECLDEIVRLYDFLHHFDRIGRGSTPAWKSGLW